jgi:hypothetical protein
MVQYEAPGLKPDMSMLEALDVLNESLILRGEDPIAFEHDCREGICGSCGFMVNGVAHGPLPETTVCQLSLRSFEDGEDVYLEPWRARAFPVLRDLMVDRGAFDRIIAAGGYVSFQPAARPTATRSWFPSRTPTAPWTPQRASAAELVLLRARTRRRRSSPVRKFRTSAYSRRASPSGPRAHCAWSDR